MTLEEEIIRILNAGCYVTPKSPAALAIFDRLWDEDKVIMRLSSPPSYRLNRSIDNAVTTAVALPPPAPNPLAGL